MVVDVSPHGRTLVPGSFDEPPSGWAILLSRLLGKPMPLPSMVEILYRTATLSSDRLSRLAYDQADLVLAPPVGSFGIVQFRALDELIDIGYRYTMKRLERLDRAGTIGRLMTRPEGTNQAGDSEPQQHTSAAV